MPVMKHGLTKSIIRGRGNMKKLLILFLILITTFAWADPRTRLDGRPINDCPLIILASSPGASTTGYAVGTVWINSATNRAYILTDVTAGSATWTNFDALGAAADNQILFMNGTVIDGVAEMVYDGDYLQISETKNGAIGVGVTNGSDGISAQAELRVTNDNSEYGTFTVFGTGYTGGAGLTFFQSKAGLFAATIDVIVGSATGSVYITPYGIGNTYAAAFMTDGTAIFKLNTDVASGNGFTFKSAANIELTDTNAESSWMYIEDKYNGANTGRFNSIKIKSAETNIGTGGHNFFIAGTTSDEDIITIDNRGGISSPEVAVFEDEMWNGINGAWATRTSTGSGAAQARSNGWYRLTTGGTDNNEESRDFNDVVGLASTLRPSIEVRLDLELLTTIRVAVGFMEAGGSDDFINVVYDTDVDTNWNANVSTAGTPSTDAGAAGTLNETTIKIEFADSDTIVQWYINGVNQGAISTNVPTAALQPYLEVVTRETGVHYVDFDYVKVWQDRE